SQGFTATFVTASGFPLRIDGTAGTFATELPVNGTFAEFLNMTSSLLVHNTSVLYQLALPTHAVCTTRTASAICDLALIGQPASVGFSGQLSALTSPSGIAGHLLFVGPQPSTNRTEASSSSDGRFSLSLPPGDYDLYANAASGGFALNERITIGQANETNVSLVLLKAWTATLTVLPPSGEIVGGANVTFQAFGAPPVVFPMTAGSGPYSLALPPESYVVNVSAPSDPFGVPTNATAGVTLPMSNGNAAATLKLSDDLLRTASLSFTLGDVPANITLPPSGGVVSLGFVVHNTGNAPESLVLSASPSTWNYTLRPSHVDLGVLGGSATASGTLIVRVPAGTPVAHPLLVLTAELNGTSKVAGHSVLPPPIAILPAPGVELGPSPTVEPIVSTSSVTVALFVRNTGNVAETVSIAVVDGSRLATLGWSTTVKSAGSEVTHPLRLDAAGNDSISITLNATRGLAQPPGSVTVEATAGNLSSAAPTSTAVVPIPIAQVSINGSQLSVSGPGIGPTPTYPDWLVPLLSFVPALALLAGLASYRWYRTRKWVR
ncbi:MAG TPA: hypothetical protein VGS18_01535, partial [Thermoplasmata archaeon]|nr:hypothetical protein [Thermoplasmata archaeon]